MPLLDLTPEMWTLIMFGLLLLLFLGHPLGYVLGGVATIVAYFAWGPQSLGLLANRTFGLMSSYVLVAIPFFVFMGIMLGRSGVAGGLFSAMHLLVGRIPGGLAVGTILIATLFGAATGVVGASVTTMGILALPAMVERNYNKELAAGTVMAGGVLGILIPPSIMLVIMGPAANVSVGKLYSGALLPGLVLSALYVGYVLVRCWLNPRMGPPMAESERMSVSVGQKAVALVRHLLPTLLLIVGVLGSIIAGIATPTEAAAIGAAGSMLLVAAYRKLTWHALRASLRETMRVSSMLMIVAIGANAFTSVFLGIGGGDVVSNLLLGMGLGKWGIFATMMLIIFVMGMFLDWLGIVLIVIPIFLPIATSLGFDPLWFTLAIAVNLQMSFLTPPFGYALFYLKGIAPDGVTMGHLYRAVIPYVGLQALGLILMVIFPQIVLWLPSVGG